MQAKLAGYHVGIKGQTSCCHSPIVPWQRATIEARFSLTLGRGSRTVANRLLEGPPRQWYNLMVGVSTILLAHRHFVF